MIQTDPITLLLAQLSTSTLRDVVLTMKFHVLELRKVEKNKNYTDKYTPEVVQNNTKVANYVIEAANKIVARRTGAVSD